MLGCPKNIVGQFMNPAKFLGSSKLQKGDTIDTHHIVTIMRSQKTLSDDKRPESYKRFHVLSSSNADILHQLPTIILESCLALMSGYLEGPRPF